MHFRQVIKAHNLKIGFESHNFFKNKEFDIKLLADTLNCGSVLHILSVKEFWLLNWFYEEIRNSLACREHVSKLWDSTDSIFGI